MRATRSCTTLDLELELQRLRQRHRLRPGQDKIDISAIDGGKVTIAHFGGNDLHLLGPGQPAGTSSR